jgi:prepilin-type N-terminal cleavage/methylation domain-containing protein
MKGAELSKGSGHRGRGVRGGFTLLEVMIAITIFAMVLAAIYSSWSAILRGSRAGLKAAAEAQRTRVALRAVEESLGATELFLENIRYYWFMADTSGDFAAISFVSHLPPSFPGSGLFGEQAVRRVTFSVEPGKNGENLLMLRQTPLLEPPETASDPYDIVLAPNVREFKMFFWDTNAMEWMEEWLWTNRLPKLVRVRMAFGDSNRPLQPDEVAVKTVYLSSAAIPRDAQMPVNRRLRPGQPGQPPNVNPPGSGTDGPRPPNQPRNTDRRSRR